jgi:drug/metabolite transporter (DMT)-like permease
MLYLPIIGSLALAAGTILQRTLIKKKSMGIKLYQSAEFLAIAITSLPFLYFMWKVDSTALTTANILIFALVVIFSFIANILLYYSMKWEKVTHLEPAKLTESLFVVVLAAIFSFIFGTSLYERNLNVIIPALIASLALILSHVKKHHLDFNRYIIAAIFGSFFFALELVLSRLILDFYSPMSFYFLRCAAILIISIIAFRPKLEKIENKAKIHILVIGFIWVVYRIVLYYGYIHLGIIFTTLTIMLSPILIYFFAHKYLKEKLEWRNIAAAVVIVACIIYVLIV